MCLVGIRGSEMTSGCSPAQDFLTQSALNVGIYDTQAANGSPTVVIAGVARSGISAVRVSFGNVTRTAQVSPGGGFEYTAVGQQGTPTTIAAIDASGRVVETVRP
jgi:hypothetical protein